MVSNQYNAANDYRMKLRAYDPYGRTFEVIDARVPHTASAANRMYPKAAGGQGKIAIAWTEGTGSPYDVQVAVIPISQPAAIDSRVWLLTDTGAAVGQPARKRMGAVPGAALGGHLPHRRIW